MAAVQAQADRLGQAAFNRGREHLSEPGDVLPLPELQHRHRPRAGCSGVVHPQVEPKSHGRLQPDRVVEVDFVARTKLGLKGKPGVDAETILQHANQARQLLWDLLSATEVF